jgi:caffeoyl-CoA O-methyltransferase
MDKILEIIDYLEKNKNPISLSKESIEFIAILSRALKPKNFLEIGTLHGHSSLWFSLFAENVTTLEADENSAQIAEENFKKSGANNIELILGDAKETLKKLNKKFNIILIDAKKSEYKEYLILSLKLLERNGIIFADNTISHKDRMKDFFEFLSKSNLYYKELNLGKGLMLISNRIDS